MRGPTLLDRLNFRQAAAERRVKARDTDIVLSNEILAVSQSEEAGICPRLRTSPNGLEATEAQARLASVGPNVITREGRPSVLRELWGRAKNPLNALLLSLATVSYFLGDIRAAIVIAIMVILAITTAFVQEHRSNDAAAKLRAMVKTTASVKRRGARPDAGENQSNGFSEISMERLVPGDIVRLSAGDMIPADLRLLSTKDLFINQAALTGEAMPSEKSVLANAGEIADPFDLPNLCFMGGSVVSGFGTGVIVHTGTKTYFGQLADKIAGQRELTSFDKGVNRFTWLMIRFILVMVPAVLLINGLTKGDWLEALLFAVAVAVGLTPEMLPMIVTVNLAKGAIAMSKKRVIVKRLHAIQNFGAMDVLCTDKTGTLTQDRIILKLNLDIRGNDCERVLEFAYLNSHYQSGLKNLLDVAVLQHVEIGKNLHLQHQYENIDEIPFDFVRRRLSVILSREDGSHVLICKGAIEEVFKIITGDNEIVTRKICREVGLEVDRIALGPDIEPMSEGALAELAEKTAVFAKVSPAQKARVIGALHSNGHVVGFLGDGINDSPALKAVDVGISVDTAVDIAKESADIILLEKSLMVLQEGVIEGRKVFANITKYIKMGASSNFGNMFSVLGASIFLPFLPMLPIQVLTNNLLYDFSQTAIPTDNVDEDYLKVPRK